MNLGKEGKMKDFEIPNIPQTTNKCIRFPNDLIEEIEDIICDKETTFSSFVIAATRYVVDELKEKKNKEV